MVALDRHLDGLLDAADPATAADAFGYETTRYLCGAAYTDPAFRVAVLAHSREKFRARAPEVGIDVGLVTEYCRRAERSKAVRDYIVLGPSILLYLSGLVTLVVGVNAPVAALVALGWLVATIATVAEGFRYDGVVRGELTQEAFHRRATPPDLDRDGGNVVVYSGFSPFVGAGVDLGGWSFAVDLERPRSEPTARPPRGFKVEDLYTFISGAFERLQIPNLRLINRLFVSGRTIRSDRLFLPNVHARPISRVEDAVVAGYATSGFKTARYYLCVETVDWNGELAVTLFIRLRKLSSKLFVELSAFVLPPLKPGYYRLDQVHPKRRFRDGFALLVGGVVKAYALLLFVPLFVVARIHAALSRDGQEREQERAIDEDLLFDYGATRSLRERVAGGEWRVYFQKLDKEMHHKILQQQLLDSLVDFLDDHGVDTSEIKERTMHILNNGVIVSGGSINAQGLAVGEGARTRVSGGQASPERASA